jgi:hypothetical protein
MVTEKSSTSLLREQCDYCRQASDKTVLDWTDQHSWRRTDISYSSKPGGKWTPRKKRVSKKEKNLFLNSFSNSFCQRIFSFEFPVQCFYSITRNACRWNKNSLPLSFVPQWSSCASCWLPWICFPKEINWSWSPVWVWGSLAVQVVTKFMSKTSAQALWGSVKHRLDRCYLSSSASAEGVHHDWKHQRRRRLYDGGTLHRYKKTLRRYTYRNRSHKKYFFLNTIANNTLHS